jgi:hypothetical protein
VQDVWCGGTVDTLRVSEMKGDMVEDDLGVESPSFLSLLNN